jgi:HEAT repeat protein
LAASSDRAGADYLYSLIASSDNKRSSLALSALHHAQNNIRPTPLEAVIRDATRPPSIQRQAIKALAWTVDKPSEELLLGLLDDASLPLELRLTVIRTLGRRRSPAALYRLAKVAEDNDAAQLQATAIRVLAFYSSKEALEILRALRGRVDTRTTRHLERSIEILELRLKVSRARKYLE